MAGDTKSAFDQGDSLTDPRRKRLRFRSWHRGIKEMDLLLGPFADRHLGGMSEGDLDGYEALLEESDPDLYNWISGREPIPETQNMTLLRRIIDFHNL